MKYPISKISNAGGSLKEEIVEVRDCTLGAALDHFYFEYDAPITHVTSMVTYEVTDQQYYQVPVIESIEENGDDYVIYRMPLWVSEN